MNNSTPTSGEKPTRIFRATKGPFVWLDRAVIQDRTLSWEARGMYAYIISNPNFTFHDLLRKCGKEKAYKTLNELKVRGLVPIPEDTPGYVYCIKPDWHNVYKIGSSVDVEDRMKTLQSGRSYRLAIVGVNHYPRCRQAELQWHFSFREYRLSGDWFALTDAAVNRFVRNEP